MAFIKFSQVNPFILAYSEPKCARGGPILFPDQTWTGVRNFQKLEEDAEEHHAKSTFLLKIVNRDQKVAVNRKAHVCIIVLSSRSIILLDY